MYDKETIAKKEECEEKILDLLEEFKMKAIAAAAEAGLDFGENCGIEVIIRKDYLSVWNNYWERPVEERIYASRIISREEPATATRHYVA